MEKFTNILSIIHDGKNKKIYQTNETGIFKINFIDDSVKISVIRSKLSAKLFSLLKQCGILNHYIENISLKEHKIIALDMLPIKFKVFLYVNHELSKNYNLVHGEKLTKPIICITLNHSDQIITEQILTNLDWVSQEDLDNIKNILNRMVDIVYVYFKVFDFTVSDFEVEFGKRYKDNGSKYDIYIGNELSFNTINLLNEEQISEERYFEIAKNLNIN